VAFELGWSQWKMALASEPGEKPRRRTIDARDLAALERELSKARERFNLPIDAPVYTCYEAGRDGFWLHRVLRSQDIENVVVDSASIEVNRRAKSDKLDAGKLLAMLIRYHTGEPHVWCVLRVPETEDEDARHWQRELASLKGERNRHIGRIEGLLANHGVAEKVDAGLRDRLDTLCTRDGRPIQGLLRGRIERELERLELVDRQIRQIEQERKQAQRHSDNKQARQVRQLCALRGVGPESAWLTVTEVFGWRQIRNRKELAALAGLAPTPYDSGGMQHDQGISKAGNKRVRWMMTELAWSWLRHQPQSELSQWWQRRFGSGSKRQRRIGVIALARKLLIKLWQYLETGVVPEGAVVQTG
jgi:transposase